MSRFALLILVAGITAACERGSTSPAISGASQTVLPIADLPAYALLRNAQFSSQLQANVDYGTPDIFCHAPQAGSGAVTLVADHSTPQSVVVGRDGQGAPYVIVVLTDFSTSQSVLQLFRDTTGDGLPDQSTKTTLASLNGVALHRAMLHVGSGTMYVADGLNSSVLRFPDTTGDLVPDAGSTTYMTGITVRGMKDPAQSSVGVFVKHGRDAIDPYRFTSAADANGDGVADSFSDLGRRGSVQFDDFGILEFVPLATDGAVKVHVSSTGSWTLEGNDGGQYATLATFDGADAPQDVTLSRSLVEGEEIRLVEAATGKTYGERLIRAATTMLITTASDPAGVVEESGTVVFTGRNITGAESVAAKRAEDTTWTTCTVTGSTTGTLSVGVPDFGLTESEFVTFRIRPIGISNDEFTVVVVMKPNTP